MIQVYSQSMMSVVRLSTLSARNGDPSSSPRVKGHLEVKHPVFYITTGKGGTSTPPTPPPDDHIKINVPTPKIYEHKETFESNYEVDLTKYDYETGKELKDSTWAGS